MRFDDGEPERRDDLHDRGARVASDEDRAAAFVSTDEQSDDELIETEEG